METEARFACSAERVSAGEQAFLGQLKSVLQV